MRKILFSILIASALCAVGRAQTQELIDVGDHKLAIARTGQGRPTVVLEGGGGGNIRSWNVLLTRISEFSSAFAYARAGRDESESATTPRTPTAIVEELRTLLQRAGNKPPYVLVGISLGGIYVRAFAMMYPDEIAGLVFVDSSHERQGIVFARATGIALEDYLKMARSHVKDDAMRREMEGLQPVMRTGDLGIAQKLPDVPMVVITNTQSEGPPAAAKAWRELQDEVFRSTTLGMHIVTNKVGHDIAGRDPDLVINAVLWVVEAVRRDKAENLRQNR